MSLFPKKNPLSIRKGYVEIGDSVQCEICHIYLHPGTWYDDSCPRCPRCWYV